MASNVTVIPATPTPPLGTAAAPDKLRVAAYCRVSTDHEEQLGSFANQVDYYAHHICTHPGYELAGIFADEGISGTGADRRPGFQQLIAACEAGKVDLVLTKSISRFARNTQDCLRYSRRLKELGVGIRFEKEGIYTLDASGELLFTILSSLAQEESRNISENTAWGIRSRFAKGIGHVNASCLLGYDKDARGKLVVNPSQARVVRRVYQEFLEGWSASEIARRLNAERVPGVHGDARWHAVSITRLLRNEVYKGDLLMQKTYTASFLTKRQLPNTGQLAQYLVENDHEPIVDAEQWEAAQLELRHQQLFRERHGIRMLGSRNADPLHARVYCATCGAAFARVTGPRARVRWWRCAGAKEGTCATARVSETALHAALTLAWEGVLADRARLEARWQKQLQFGDALQRLRASQMRALAQGAAPAAGQPDHTRMTLEELLVHDVCSYEVRYRDGIVRRVRVPVFG